MKYKENNRPAAPTAKRSSEKNESSDGQQLDFTIPVAKVEDGTAPKSKDVPTDPFADLSKLKVCQTFTEMVGVRKALLRVPINKPKKQDFIRVHPSENMRLVGSVIELKEECEYFLVVPDVAKDIPDEVTTKILVTAINRQNDLFVWPINADLEEPGVRRNHWNESARTAAELATKGWVRVVAKMSLGSYEVFQATGKLSEPEWPDHSFQEILKTAFKDKIITSLDHPVIRKLLGLE